MDDDNSHLNLRIPGFHSDDEEPDGHEQGYGDQYHAHPGSHDSIEPLLEDEYGEASESEYEDESEESEEEEIVLDEKLISFAKSMAHLSDDELYELIAYNATCLEYLQKMINKTDRAVLENMEAMEAVHEQLATGNSKVNKKTKIPIILYDKPYFKDSFGMTALPNSEAKNMYNNHKMATLLKEERAWSQIEVRKLNEGVQRSLLKNLNLQYSSRLEILEYKMKNFSSAKNTEEERLAWKSEMESIKRKISYNNNLPVEELFSGDYKDVDWREIAMVDLNGERSPIAVQMRWCNEDCPQINKGPWTKEEDATLKNVACQSWTNWKFVAHELGTHRSEFMCICRAKELYTKVYREPQAWTAEEDEKLLSIVSNCRNIQSIAWDKVAKLMTSRTAAQCKIRFKQSLMQTLRHGRWTEAEDMFLLDAVNRYGPIDWSKIASCVPGRNEGQCRSRWTNFLDIKREPQPWTAEDDELLLHCVRILGKGKWSELSTLFDNRNPVDLRSRYLHFIRTKIKEKKLDYGARVSNQFLISLTRRSIILSRFHELETDDSKLINYDDTYKRFGIGNFIVNPSIPKRPRDNNRHVYQSGIYRKPLSKDERRIMRYNKFLESLTEEQKKELNDVKENLNIQKAKKAEEAEKAKEENRENEFFTNQAYEDSNKITKFLYEIVKIDEHELKQMEKRRIPRVRIRRRYPKKPGRKEDPEVTARKLKEAALMKDIKKKHEALRELPIIQPIAQLLNLNENQVKHVDGSDKRIRDLVLLEDNDGKPYWITTREESILNLILEVNKTLVRGSLYNYENFWRINSSNRCKEYFRKILTVDLPPVVHEKSEESLENYRDLLSDLMFPCRGTLTAVQQNRIKARQIYNIMANKYFDSVDSEGRYVRLQENELSTGRLDIRLSRNITDSEDYRLLKKRIFKMFFLPMMMEYGQRNVVKVYGTDTILMGDPVTSISYIRPIDQSIKVDESIEAVVSMASQSVNQLNKKHTKDTDRIQKKNGNSDDNDIDESETLQIPSSGNENTVGLEGGRRRNQRKKKNTVVNEEVNEEPSRKKKKDQIEERHDDEEDSTVEVVVLNPNVVLNPPKGAYKPRWVKKNMKNRDEPPKNPEEMTLADLLFVKGRRTKRAPTGLYDRQHNDNILGTLREEIRLEQEKKSNEESQPYLVDERVDEETERRTVVKSELMDGNQ